MTESKAQIAPLLLPWFEQHGRKQLPWQQPRDSYRVWLSEIMLQQTQVATVIPYFNRFIERFPNIDTLACARLDEVLLLWSGLGYYARARNLHRAAVQVQQDFQSQLPANHEQLQSLPGIGRSTAGAILSLGFAQRAVILDGNVKRVLSRVYQVEGWPGKSAVLKQLWQLAESETPQSDCDRYNQAMMDLGALVCSKSKPACADCPLNTVCLAFSQQNWSQFPGKKPKKTRPLKKSWFVLHQFRQQILLIKRPPQGIWGGLWCLPELNEIEQLESWQSEHLGEVTALKQQYSKLLLHRFSHFDLEISLGVAELENFSVHQVADEETGLHWVDIKDLNNLGMPSPMLSLLDKAGLPIEKVVC